MASKKTSVRIREHVLDLFALLGKSDTEGITQVADNYLVMVKYAMPKLEKYEHLALVDMYNSHFFDDNIEMEAKAMDWHVAESYKHQPSCVEILASGNINKEDFANKVKSWTIPERIAVIHSIKEFWHKKG